MKVPLKTKVNKKTTNVLIKYKLYFVEYEWSLVTQMFRKGYFRIT